MGGDESFPTALRIPFVRVLLTDKSDRYEISADQSFAIECLDNGEQTVFYSVVPVTVRLFPRGLEVRSERDELIATGLDEVSIIPRGSQNRFELEGKRYRGLLSLSGSGSVIRAVNTLYIEEYLRGVVPSEIGDRTQDELEAVKAQAVAARTYAMAHLGQYDGEPYDLKATVADQVYDGADSEVDMVSYAIDQTVGVVASYQDALIDAYYHSTCGGTTDDIQDVWEKPARPYLRGVADDSSCSWSKYFRWTERFTEPQLRSRLEQFLSSDRGRELRIGQLADLQIGERTPGGRIERLSVRTEDDTYRFFKDRIRWAIGRSGSSSLILPSAKFDIELGRGESGQLNDIVLHGSGYGHGVGMCQCGAIGRSRDGWTYDMILKHYYTDIELKRLF